MPHDLTPIGAPTVSADFIHATQKSPISLYDIYSKYFMIIPADSDSLLEKFYRLRYQVYCIENSFENSKEYPHGLEIDEYDPHSVSSLLVHVPTGIIAGGIRIILPFQDGQLRELPVWRVCDQESYVARRKDLPVGRTAEVSRIAVSKEFRQLCAEKWNDDETDSWFRIMRQLSLGLLGAVVRMSAECGITHVGAVMERPMLRMFGQLGVHLQKLGNLVEYHGLRQPTYADLDRLLTRTWIERPDVWAIMTNCGEYWPLNQSLAHTISTKPPVNAGCA